VIRKVWWIYNLECCFVFKGSLACLEGLVEEKTKAPKNKGVSSRGNLKILLEGKTRQSREFEVSMRRKTQCIFEMAKQTEGG
jgi:hypothetical protein